jgi:hypothetical protein
VDSQYLRRLQDGGDELFALPIARARELKRFSKVFAKMAIFNTILKG